MKIEEVTGLSEEQLAEFAMQHAPNLREDLKLKEKVQYLINTMNAHRQMGFEGNTFMVELALFE